MAKEISSGAGLCDYPLHRFKNLERKLYKLCIIEHGDDLVQLTQGFLDGLDTKEFARFLHGWAYKHLNLVVTNRLQAQRLLQGEALWTITKSVRTDAKRHCPANQARALEKQLGGFRKRLFLVSARRELLQWVTDHSGPDCARKIAAEQLETGGQAQATRPATLIKRLRKGLQRHCPEEQVKALQAQLDADTPDLERSSLVGVLYPWVVEHVGAEAALSMTAERLESPWEVEPVLRRLQQDLDRLCPVDTPTQRRKALRRLRNQLFHGTLAETLSQWYERDVGPTLERRIRGTLPDHGEAIWRLLPPLFAVPERMALQLSYSMMDLGAALESHGDAPQDQEPPELRKGAAIAILWTQLWRYFPEAMADLDGSDGVGPQVIRNWRRIQKELAKIRQQWQGDEDQLDGVARLESLRQWQDIPMLAVEVVDRIGEQLDIKDPGRIVEYIRAFAGFVSLEDEAAIPDPAIEAPDEDLDLDRLRECLQRQEGQGGLNPKQRQAIGRLYLRDGKQLTPKQYLKEFLVHKHGDKYHEPQALAKLAACMNQPIGGNHEH